MNGLIEAKWSSHFTIEIRFNGVLVGHVTKFGKGWLASSGPVKQRKHHATAQKAARKMWGSKASVAITRLEKETVK